MNLTPAWIAQEIYRHWWFYISTGQMNRHNPATGKREPIFDESDMPHIKDFAGTSCTLVAMNGQRFRITIEEEQA